MNILKSLFSSTISEGHLKVKYSKADNTWHVMDGLDVVYMGDKDKCIQYLNHRKMMKM